MTTTSHAATDDYRAGWERVFGKPDCTPIVPAYWVLPERRLVWPHLNGSPFAIRRFMTTAPLIEGAAYGTQMKERRVLSDRRK